MDAAILAFDEAIAGDFTTLTTAAGESDLTGAAPTEETNFTGTVDIDANVGAETMATKKQYALKIAEFALQNAVDGATNLGIAEKTVELQKDFLANLTDQIDEGTGAMVDADMEAEAAKLQAFQVQQQLSTQALSIANQAPQNIMSLFR